MKRLQTVWNVLLLALLVSVSGLNAQAAVGFKSVVLSRGYVNGKAVGVTNVFKTTDRTIHCVAVTSRILNNTTARGTWVAVDAGGYKNFKIVEKELTVSKVNILHFYAWLPRNWPTGKYRCDIYIGGKLARSVPYTIVK